MKNSYGKILSDQTFTELERSLIDYLKTNNIKIGDHTCDDIDRWYKKYLSMIHKEQ